MKILVFTDLHGSKPALERLKKTAKKEKPDFMICSGDITIFERDMDKILKKLDKLGKMYIIHGNHEMEEALRKACKQYENIKFAHKKIVNKKGTTFIFFGGGGFSKKDEEFEDFIKKNKDKLKKKRTVLVTHGPPYKTSLDYLDHFQEHVGCESYTKYIKKYRPEYAISGHLHENFGKEDRMKDTQLINPGPTGKVIEL